MTALVWATFAARMLPYALDLLRDLHRRHGGNLEAARAELRQIRDHWAKVSEVERFIDERLDALKRRKDGE